MMKDLEMKVNAIARGQNPMVNGGRFSRWSVEGWDGGKGLK